VITGLSARFREDGIGETRFALARKAFSHTASYDGAVSNWLTARGPDGAAAAFPDRFNLQAVKVQDLRYGENPHQQAAFYVEPGIRHACLASAEQIHGKELSFNNLLDLDSCAHAGSFARSMASSCGTSEEENRRRLRVSSGVLRTGSAHPAARSRMRHMCLRRPTNS
jgi:AICAR transformylase/IMP cyclohydrolase PurH